MYSKDVPIEYGWFIFEKIYGLKKISFIDGYIALYIRQCANVLLTPLIAKFMRPTWGLPGADRPQVGHVNFAIWVTAVYWCHTVL